MVWEVEREDRHQGYYCLVEKKVPQYLLPPVSSSLSPNICLGQVENNIHNMKEEGKSEECYQ